MKKWGEIKAQFPQATHYREIGATTAHDITFVYPATTLGSLYQESANGNLMRIWSHDDPSWQEAPEYARWMWRGYWYECKNPIPRFANLDCDSFLLKQILCKQIPSAMEFYRMLKDAKN